MDGKLGYELVRRKGQRSIVLRVLPPDGRIRVSAGPRRSKLEIDLFVASRAGWIEQQRAKIAARPQREPVRFADGETAMIWGKPVTLRIVAGKGRHSIALKGDELVISAPAGSTTEQRRALFERFLRRTLAEAIDRLLPYWERRTGLSCSGYQIRDMKSRWGSCTIGTRKIRFALRLAEYPPECLEMVIVHELGHLRHPDHGAGFQAHMDAYLPDWRQTRKLLKN